MPFFRQVSSIRQETNRRATSCRTEAQLAGGYLLSAEASSITLPGIKGFHSHSGIIEALVPGVQRPWVGVSIDCHSQRPQLSLQP